MMMLKQALILVVIFLCGCTETAPDEQSDPDELIEIMLQHPQFEVPIMVPRKYIGPKFLRLSQKNVLGGKQRTVLLEFYYPSFNPVQTKFDHSEENSIYISLTASIPEGIKNYSLGKTEDGSFYSESEEKELCGLKRLNARSDLEWHKRTFLYYATDDNLEAIAFDCADFTEFRTRSNGAFIASYAPVVGKVKGPCRVHMQASERLSLTINGYPGDQICEWRDLRHNMKTFVGEFLVEENE